MMLMASAIGVISTGVGAFFVSKLGLRKDPKNCYHDGQKIAYGDACVDMETKILVPKYFPTQNPLVQLSPQLYINANTVESQSIQLGNALQCTCVSGIEANSQGEILKGQCYEMSCTVLSSGQLFIEAAGGSGGNYSFYDSDGTFVIYSGGLPGIVYTTIVVSAGDIILVKYGFSADGQQASPGGGGSGTPASSAGGGATQVYHNGKLVLVASGGGGASKNATGGHGGSFGIPVFGKVHEMSDGQPGGTLFETTNTQAPSTLPNELSGGGANVSSPGTGLDTRGDRLQGANAIMSQFGGGGGGSGYYGGAAGAWNKQLKPFNLHGGGGGGSSYTNGYFSMDICPYDRGVQAPASSYVTFGYPLTINV